jgi:hypothetical protein
VVEHALWEGLASSVGPQVSGEACNDRWSPGNPGITQVLLGT